MKLVYKAKERFYNFFFTFNVQILCVFYIYDQSQSGLATFQIINSYITLHCIGKCKSTMWCGILILLVKCVPFKQIPQSSLQVSMCLMQIEVIILVNGIQVF